MLSTTNFKRFEYEYVKLIWRHQKFIQKMYAWLEGCIFKANFLGFLIILLLLFISENEKVSFYPEANNMTVFYSNFNFTFNFFVLNLCKNFRCNVLGVLDHFGHYCVMDHLCHTDGERCHSKWPQSLGLRRPHRPEDGCALWGQVVQISVSRYMVDSLLFVMGLVWVCSRHSTPAAIKQMVKGLWHWIRQGSSTLQSIKRWRLSAIKV